MAARVDFHRLPVVQVVFLDEYAPGVELRGKPPHLVARVEDGLLARRDRRGQLPVVALVPQPQRALEAGQEP